VGSDVTSPGVRVIGIEFPNGNRAQAVFAGPRRTAESLLADLGLTDPRPVLLVIGGAETMDQATGPQLERLLERGAIPVANEAGATVLDGGTASGVMASLGRAAARSESSVPLVGVAPAGKVTYPGDDRGLPGANTQLEPNHTHYLLADSDDWGGETSLLFDVLDALARGQPAAVLVAGGGSGALDEVRAAAQRGLPILVITGSGGIADALAARRRSTERSVGDTSDALIEIADEADLILLPLTSEPADMARAISRHFEVDETLRDAWAQHTLVSNAARRQQGDFRIEQLLILILGVALTILVVAKAVLDGAGLMAKFPAIDSGLHFVIVLVPITIATLVAAAGRMRPGTRWILLRGTAEGLKGEIYRYRARAGIYSSRQTRTTPREVKLAQSIGSAMGSLMRTDVNLLGFDQGLMLPSTTDSDGPGRGSATPLDPEADDRLGRLTPRGYMKHRLDDQITWYGKKTAQIERQARWLRWFALGFGGLGTLLAAVGFEIWVAVTTALVGAYTTYLESWQMETTVVLYNQAATDLSSIRRWWNALPTAEQNRQDTIDRLVDRAERTMRGEHVGWVQEMQDAMTQLRLEQAADAPSDGRRQPDNGSGDTPTEAAAPPAQRGAAARVGNMIGGRGGGGTTKTG
jgi:hypothetical protein